MADFVSVRDLGRKFNVSLPWLERVISRTPKQYLDAVNNVSFEIAQGQVYALVGESGSGKSTIGRMLVGLLQPTQGSVEINGVNLSAASAEEMSHLRANMQMIFQDPQASLNPRWRIGDIIEEPAKAAGTFKEGLAGELLEKVGLSRDDASRYPREFSGGQRQRISIARALSSSPKFIVCDEPTSALDVSVQAQVLNLMSDLREQFALTLLFISHDLAVVRHLSDRVGVLYFGQLVEEGDTHSLFSNPRHPYTQMLLEASPRLDRFGHDGASGSDMPKGEIPDPLNPPSGCVFHPRCPIATEICKSQEPPMHEEPAIHEGARQRLKCHHPQ